MQYQESDKDALLSGGVGVLPTDTLYGIVGSALNPDTVDRIYDLKQRDSRKPLIVLISAVSELERFGVILSDALTLQLGNYWPGPHSIILPTIDEEFEYIHRGTDHIAFRLPDDEDLRALIAEVGPLVAPSANVEGKPPAKNVAEAKNYFGTDVDFYVEGEDLEGRASTIMELDGEEVRIVRE